MFKSTKFLREYINIHNRIISSRIVWTGVINIEPLYNESMIDQAIVASVYGVSRELYDEKILSCQGTYKSFEEYARGDLKYTGKLYLPSDMCREHLLQIERFIRESNLNGNNCSIIVTKED